MSRDPLRLSSPFPTDVDAIISDVKFVAPEQFDNGNTVLIEMTASPTEDEDYNPFTLSWKVCTLGYENKEGEWEDAWEIVNDGRSIRNLKKADMPFSKNVKFAKAFHPMLEIPGLLSVFRQRIDAGLASGPCDAALFDNLVVHIDEVEAPYNFTNQDGEKISGVSSYYVFTDFVREYGETKAPAKKAAKKAAKAAAPKADAFDSNLFDDLMDDCETLEEFATRAYADPGFEFVADDVAAQTFVDEVVAAGETGDFYLASVERCA